MYITICHENILHGIRDKLCFKYSWKNRFTYSLEYNLANISEIYINPIIYCFVISDALWFLIVLCLIPYAQIMQCVERKPLLHPAEETKKY